MNVASVTVRATIHGLYFGTHGSYTVSGRFLTVGACGGSSSVLVSAMDQMRRGYLAVSHAGFISSKPAHWRTGKRGYFGYSGSRNYLRHWTKIPPRSLRISFR